MGRVQGKIAIVTGAASGIGRATAELLAREGARVVVADRNEAGAKEVVEGIAAFGGEAIAEQVDVSKDETVRVMVERTVTHFGGLNVLHNNAALTDVSQHAGDLGVVEMDLESWDRSIAVNLRGAMLGCRYAIPHMIRSGGGSIINTSSNQSLAGDMTQCAYAVAKAGVNQLTRSVATRYGREGIRCNAVSPGMIRTPGMLAACTAEVIEEIQSHQLVPRLGEPMDLAQAVLFLASDDSSFITGQIVCVDGGQLAHLPHYAHLVKTGERTTLG